MNYEIWYWRTIDILNYGANTHNIDVSTTSREKIRELTDIFYDCVIENKDNIQSYGKVMGRGHTLIEALEIIGMIDAKKLSIFLIYDKENKIWLNPRKEGDTYD